MGSLRWTLLSMCFCTEWRAGGRGVSEPWRGPEAEEERRGWQRPEVGWPGCVSL